MGGDHARRATDGQRRVQWWTLAVVGPLALLTLAAMIWLWPGDQPDREDVGRAEQVHGTVLDVEERACGEQPAELAGTEFAQEHERCGTMRVEIHDGADDGEVVTTELPAGTGAPDVADGDDVVLIPNDTPDGVVYAIVDHQRSTGLWILMAAFALAVIAFGRWRGVTALLGLALTFVVLLMFVVPAILDGTSPLVVATVGAAAIVLAVLYLTHGFNPTTTVAVVGTIASLLLTGLLAWWSVEALHLTGITDDSSAFLGTTFGVDMRGLLVAAIIIGSLGVLDDVTVSQAATVAEVARANPAYGFADLYRAGARVGRSHVASVINTIILAYAGSSLPLVILIAAYNDSLTGVVTDQIIAQEIVRSAVATIGLVAAVPITTALAAFIAARVPTGGYPSPGPSPHPAH